MKKNLKEKSSSALKQGPAQIKLAKEKKVAKIKTRPVFSAPNLYWRLGLSIILGLAMVGGIFYSSFKLKLQATDIEQRRGQMTALSKKGESLEKLSSELSLVKDEIPLIERSLVVESQMIGFLSEIGELEEKSEMVIVSLKFTNDQPVVDKEGHHYLEMVIKGEGTADSLERFTQGVVDLPFLIRTKVFDVTNLDEPTSSMIFKAWVYTDPKFFPE